jgi:hypothetical protein
MKITIDNIPPDKVNVIVHLLNDVLSNVSASSKIKVSDAVTDVIHQRELLIAFAEYLKERSLINVRKENLAIRIDLYLKRH